MRKIATMSKMMTLRKTRLLSMKYLTCTKRCISNMPTNTHILKLVADCPHHSAEKYEHEPLGFRCRSGQVELNAPDIPNEGGGF
jgi:hypothetical protein